MTKERVVQLHENTKYKGFKGTFAENTYIMNSNEIAATSDERGEVMSNETEILKLQLKNLEQQIDEKLNSRDKLLESKLENISLKIENSQNSIMGKIETLTASINSQNEIIKKDIEIISTTKIEELKTSLVEKDKENRNFTWMIMGVAVAAATLIATIAIPIIQNYLK